MFQKISGQLSKMDKTKYCLIFFYKCMHLTGIFNIPVIFKYLSLIVFKWLSCLNQLSEDYFLFNTVTAVLVFLLFLKDYVLKRYSQEFIYLFILEIRKAYFSKHSYQESMCRKTTDRN